MKKKTWVIGGSVGAVFLLVLAMFPSVVGTHTMTTIGNIIYSEIINGEKVNEQNNVLYKSYEWWPPGYWLDVLWGLFLSFIYWFYTNIWANL
jgi:hypothetical protein